MHNNNFFIIQLYVVLSYCWSNMTKCHFRKDSQKCLILSGPVHVLSMADNGNSASSCATCDNDFFLSEVVGYSTGIAVLIMAFLIRMSVLAGQEAPILFSPKFSMNRDLNSE